MLKRKRKVAAKAVTKISEADLRKIEDETIERVNKTVSALESAIASWDAAGTKPAELKAKFSKYRLVHEVLTRWQSKAMKSRGKSDVDERLGVLWEFVDICRIYIGGDVGGPDKKETG
ncbi:MAG: hypothetical protein AB1529_08550 [Candidatus Micrarchaeota archaeon]